MDRWIDLSKLTNVRLLAAYAVLVHVSLQGLYGFETARILGDVAGNQARLSLFCLTGQPPAGEDGKGSTATDHSCTACHVHCMAAKLTSGLRVSPALYGAAWLAQGSLTVGAGQLAGLFALACRGPPAPLT